MRKKILFVDDETDLLKVSSLRLEKTGYEVFGAVDGETALDLVREKRPNLIFLDIYLPGMDGSEVAKILKEDENTKHIPIVLVSADTTILKDRFLECGTEDYLAKPFETGELVSMVKKYLPDSPHVTN